MEEQVPASAPARFPARPHIMACRLAPTGPPLAGIRAGVHRGPTFPELDELQWPLRPVRRVVEHAGRLPLRGQLGLARAALRRRFPIPVYPAPSMKEGAGTNACDATSARIIRSPFLIERASMARLNELALRIDRLLLRHEELERTNKLLLEQVASLTGERDSLKSRLGAARARVDALLERLPAGEASGRDGAP